MWILITNNNASGSGKVTVKVIIDNLWFVAVIELSKEKRKISNSWIFQY